MKLLLLIFLSLVLAVQSVQATGMRLDSAIASTRRQAVWLDSDRFPDSVLKDFFNREVGQISSMVMNSQASSIYATPGEWEFVFQNNTQVMITVELNANPAEDYTHDNHPRALKYVRPEDFGQGYTFGDSRASIYTVWQRKFRIWPPLQQYDTIFSRYIAWPTPISNAADTLKLDGWYVELALERVLIRCQRRLEYTSPSPEEIAAKRERYETILLGRPTDEQYRQEP